MAAPQEVLKTIGPAMWSAVDDAERGQIKRAILRDGKTLVLDLDCGRYEYAVNLERRDGSAFEGQWTCRDRGTDYTGVVSARLYFSDSGNFLFGRWHEDGNANYWWVELCTVERFGDESGT